MHTTLEEDQNQTIISKGPVIPDKLRTFKV